MNPLNDKNPFDRFIEERLPEPLRKYSRQIVVNLIFIVGLILFGLAFDNRFLLRLGFGALVVYAVVMAVVVTRLAKK